MNDEPGTQDNNSELIPISELEKAISKVLSNTKEQSDKQLQKLQADNVKRRKGTKSEP